MAVVDDDVFAELLASHRPKWYAQFNPHTKSWYARTNITVNGKNRGMLMHRMITRAKPGEVVDHINHDTLDNRVANLRICAHRQNSFNRKPYANNTTGFKGVFLRKETGRYRAGLRADGKMHWRGSFSSPKEAAIAYNDLAKQFHGEHASLNVI